MQALGRLFLIITAVLVPLAGRSEHIFVEGDEVRVVVPAGVRAWKLLDDSGRVWKEGGLSRGESGEAGAVDLGKLGLGWYRLEFEPVTKADEAWTTLAVLRRQAAKPSEDSPVAVDVAMAWLARDKPEEQRALANLAKLAGAGWIRDRMRWSDLEPRRGELRLPPTTYDTSALASREAGLRVLQVFHDLPRWTDEPDRVRGQFRLDLRDAYRFAKAMAERYRGQVHAWEPWNEGNIENFGFYPMDQLCTWQKVNCLGFKSGDPKISVGWNPFASVPTPEQTQGVLANEAWPYFDTYNIHSYDWPDSYESLWAPVREAASGRPIWVSEADRGTPHLKNPPWYDQEPRLERLKAEFMAQSYASSLFAGSKRHFHFVLGNYQENELTQFGLLRHDLTPRPAYVALAALGRCLARARVLGRVKPGGDVHLYAFRAWPDGREREVLVAWAEKSGDWSVRGQATADWKLPDGMEIEGVTDYLGRPLGKEFPVPLTSAPVFVILPPGEAKKLELEQPPALAPWREGMRSPVVMHLRVDKPRLKKREDVRWGASVVYETRLGETLEFTLDVYNLGEARAAGAVETASVPEGWELAMEAAKFELEPMGRASLRGSLRLPENAKIRDGWASLRAQCGEQGAPALAFRTVAAE